MALSDPPPAPPITKLPTNQGAEHQRSTHKSCEIGRKPAPCRLQRQGHHRGPSLCSAVFTFPSPVAILITLMAMPLVLKERDRRPTRLLEHGHEGQRSAQVLFVVRPGLGSGMRRR